jgi:hypothetical protein
MSEFTLQLMPSEAHTGLVIVIHCRSIIQPLNDAT